MGRQTGAGKQAGRGSKGIVYCRQAGSFRVSEEYLSIKGLLLRPASWLGERGDEEAGPAPPAMPMPRPGERGEEREKLGWPAVVAGRDC